MNCITILGIILIAFGTLLTFVGQNKGRRKDTTQLNKTIHELKIDNKELIEGKNQLLLKLEKYQADLKVKEKTIQELEKKSKKAERGITSIYDFNGTKRETTGPGQFTTIIGPEVEIFNRIQELKKSGSYLELIEVCKKQIDETPEWLTPYFYLGIGYANTNEKEKAIEKFEYVLKNAPDDPNYIQAEEFLKELKK